MTDQQNSNDPQPRTDEEIRERYEKTKKNQEARRKSLAKNQKPVFSPAQAEFFRSIGFTIDDQQIDPNLTEPEVRISITASLFVEAFNEGKIILSDQVGKLDTRELIRALLLEWIQKNNMPSPYTTNADFLIEDDITSIIREIGIEG